MRKRRARARPDARSWQIVAGTFIDRFSDRAELYRRARPNYPPLLFEALAALAPSRRLAWDCGTGNGQAAVALAAHFEAVHATDPSAQQLAQARTAAGVGYARERAEDVSLPDASVDLVLAAQALHWFDLDLFYAQVRRVLKPGGVLAAVGYDWMYVDPAIDAAIGAHLMPPLADQWAPQNALLWAGYRSIPFPGEDVRLGPFAIYLDWSFSEARAYLESWSSVRSLRAAGDPTPIDAALERLDSLWGVETRRVTIPLFIRAARLP